MTEYGTRKDGVPDKRTTLGRAQTYPPAHDATRMAPEMTQAMIEAGIRAYGSDDARSTPERVLDIWLAMNDAVEPPRPPEYEAPRDPAHQLKVRGVGLMADEPRALLVAMTERPTDDELRSFHDYAREWRLADTRYVVVPREANADMCKAIFDMASGAVHPRFGEVWTAADVWRAAIKAAPKGKA